MRVAILGDIHGNLVALDAALTDIDSSNVEQVVCLGDVCESGPYPAECLHRLLERDIPIVMGNTDERMVHPRNRDAEDEKTRILDAIEAWNVTQLNDDDLDAIANFLPTVEVDLGQGMSLLGYHGSPKGNRDLIKATSRWSHLADMFEGCDQQVLIGGHVHEQFVRPFRHQTIINTGSIGAPAIYLDEGGVDTFPEQWMTPIRAEYAMVEVVDRRVRVELRQVGYARVDLEQSVMDSDMPHGEWWLSHWM